MPGMNRWRREMDINFDPYDALCQLGKNQEFLFNREIIHNQLIHNLNQQLTLLQQQNKMYKDQLDSLHLDVAMIKLILDSQNQNDAKNTYLTPYIDNHTK